MKALLIIAIIAAVLVIIAVGACLRAADKDEIKKAWEDEEDEQKQS